MWVSSPRVAPTSTAKPVMDRQSGRLGVISQSSTTSETPRYSPAGTPTGASSGSTMMPSWSPERPSSRAEQFMPHDSTPRSLLFLILTSPGRTAPTMATTTCSPAATLGAPHTICNGAGSPFPSTLRMPTSTMVTCMWSESGCGSQDRMRPVTTWSRSAPTGSTASTSVPVRTSSATRSDTSSGRSTMVFSHS